MHQEHALVNQGAGGEGADVGLVVALLEDPADDIELPVKVQPLGNVLGALYKALPNGWHGLLGPAAQDFGIHRHLPPAQEGNALLGADHLAELLSLAALQPILGEEEHANAIVPGAA